MAKQLTKRMMEGGKSGMSGLLRCFPFHKKRAGFAAMTDAQLAMHAHWCFEYAKANATGLRKILKKHDKLFHTAEGHRFLQVCLRILRFASTAHVLTKDMLQYHRISEALP